MARLRASHAAPREIRGGNRRGLHRVGHVGISFSWAGGLGRRVPERLDAARRNGPGRRNPLDGGKNLRRPLRPLCRPRVHCRVRAPDRSRTAPTLAQAQRGRAMTAAMKSFRVITPFRVHPCSSVATIERMSSDVPVLELADATVVKDGRPVLDRVSLTIAEGEHTAIIGPNGAGKSVLVSLLTLEQRPVAPSNGTPPVRVFGRQNWDLFELRSQLGIISADLHQDLVNGNSEGSITAEAAVLSAFLSSSGTLR